MATEKKTLEEAAVERVPLIGEASEADIKKWKEQHPGGIYAVEFNGKVGYFKNPRRTEASFALSRVDEKASMAHLEALAEVTFLGGAQEFVGDTSEGLAAISFLRTKLNSAGAVLRDL